MNPTLLASPSSLSLALLLFCFFVFCFVFAFSLSLLDAVFFLSMLWSSLLILSPLPQPLSSFSSLMCFFFCNCFFYLFFYHISIHNPGFLSQPPPLFPRERERDMPFKLRRWGVSLVPPSPRPPFSPILRFHLWPILMLWALTLPRH
ncbi:hypothetical protein AMTRI_Chr06g199170 [Amborella trichopoda]